MLHHLSRLAAQALFNKLDEDHDGSLRVRGSCSRRWRRPELTLPALRTRAQGPELKQLTRELLAVPHDMAERVVQRFDSNKDGEIDFAEFVVVM